MSQDEIETPDTDDVAGHAAGDRIMVRKTTPGLSTGALGGEDDVEGHGLLTDQIGGKYVLTPEVTEERPED